MKTLPEVKPRELLSNHIHIRLTDSDYNQIKAHIPHPQLAHTVGVLMESL
jgi:hypothetical protein